MGIWGSVIMALVFPIAWGLGSAWLFDKLTERRERIRKARRAAEIGQ